MSDVRVNLINNVDSKKIRVENIDGEPHLIIPSYTLPGDIVMNNGFYPAAEIDKAWPSIENTLAPIGHPTNANGDWVSAFSPEGIHNFHGGAWNRNARKEGNRIAVDKVVNIRYALQSEPGRRLLAAVNYDEKTGTAAGPDKPIHTSTGLLLVQDAAPAGAAYKWVARNMRLDHDAILLDEPGAATPEQGVGMMVNTDQAISNLSEDNSDTRREALREAVRTRFGDSGWVVAFDDNLVVFETEQGSWQLAYTMVDMVATLSADEPTKVERRTTWVEKIANLWKSAVSSKTPITNQPGEEDSMPLSKEDLEAIDGLISNKLNTIAERLDKHGEELSSLKTNSEQLAQSVKAEGEKRLQADKALVAEKHGEAVANALSPEKVTEIANALRAGNGSEALPNGQQVEQNNSNDGEWGQVPSAKGGA